MEMSLELQIRNLRRKKVETDVSMSSNDVGYDSFEPPPPKKQRKNDTEFTENNDHPNLNPKIIEKWLKNNKYSLTLETFIEEQKTKVFFFSFLRTFARFFFQKIFVLRQFAVYCPFLEFHIFDAWKNNNSHKKLTQKKNV